MTELDQARLLLQRYYRLDGELRRLGGDRDSNFRVHATDGAKYVLKLTHSDCSPDRVDLQCAALAHLADCPLNLPRVIPDVEGRPWRVVDVAGAQRPIWLLSWCQGTLLSELAQHGTDLAQGFGHSLATLDRALAGFSHPAAAEPNTWQLTGALACRDLADCVADSHRSRVREVFAQFEQHALPTLAALPQRVIHNDANDHNVLVNQGRVDGLIDFGDMGLQPLACEVAIALAYLVMGKSEPLPACAAFLRGFLAVEQLEPEARQILPELVNTRLAVSVSISSYRQLTEPDDPYIVVSQRPARDALTRLAGLEREFRALLDQLP